MALWGAIGAIFAAVIAVTLLKALFRAQSRSEGARSLIALCICAIPIAAAALYFDLGAPDTADQPLSERFARDADITPLLAADPHVAAATLAERTHNHPYDLRAWLGLAEAYAAIGRYPEAADALEKARALEPARPEILAAAAGAIAAQAAGLAAAPQVGAAVDRLRAQDPNHPTGRYLAGLAAWQKGDAQAALAIWLPLMRAGDRDAPWRMALQEQIEIAALDLGEAAAEALPEQGSGPRGVADGPEYGATDMPDGAVEAATFAETPEEKLGLIRRLTAAIEDRLRASPDDAEGWRRLARTYQVLGEPRRALAAWAGAAEAAPERVDILIDYAHAARETTEEAWPQLSIALLERALTLDPAHPDALWSLAEAADEAGDRTQARSYWRTLAGHRQLDPARRETARLRAAR